MNQGMSDTNNAGWWSSAPTAVIMVPCVPAPPLLGPPPAHSGVNPYTGHLMTCDVRIGFPPSGHSNQGVVYRGGHTPMSHGGHRIVENAYPHTTAVSNIHENNPYPGYDNNNNYNNALVTPYNPHLSSRNFAVTRSGRTMRNYRRTDNNNNQHHNGGHSRSVQARPQQASSSPQLEAECPDDQDDSSSELCCSVCLDSYVSLQRQNRRVVVLTTCHHVFCQTCIERLASSPKKCPKCRQPILSADPYRLIYF